MKATWNSDSFALYLQPVFDRMPSLQDDLLFDFISLKRDGLFPAVFGKDGPYTQPGAIVASRVYHIHLLLTPADRSGARMSYDRTSDRALVYTRHAKHSDVYSLLAIFPDKAHALARDRKIMGDMARYAEAFQRLTHP